MGSERGQRSPVATVKLYRVEEKGASDAAGNEVRGPSTTKMKIGAIEKIDASELVEIEIDSAQLLLDGSVTVGRRSNCNLQPVNRENRSDGTVSRIHCIISAREGERGEPSILITCVSGNCIFREDIHRVPESASKIFEEDSFYTLGGNVRIPNIDSEPRRYRLRYEIRHSD